MNLEPSLPIQTIGFHRFKVGKLAELLELKPPPLTRQALRQFEYIEKYLVTLKCKSVAIEQHYIDKDSIEDHAIFYSKSLFSYPNYCRRVHFFTIPADAASNEVTKLAHSARKRSESEQSAACLRFSNEHYLGFAVIKPLPGCPVGRTILRSLPDGNANGLTRRFSCTRVSRIHFAGIELTIRGLVFQQQDTGVSACATTAIWCALHKMRDFEEVVAATPAQITMMAARYTLPFGRAMPSEGLSMDQMCVAVQELGISPNLFRVTDFSTSRAYLYSATDSGIPSVLILRDSSGNRRHAVTVAGMKVRSPHVETLLVSGQDDEAGDLQALYVHDDRLGPYLRADVFEEEQSFELKIQLEYAKQPRAEKWTLTHILIPMHNKIRLSFGGLRKITVGSLVPRLHSARVSRGIVVNAHGPVTFSNRIIRPQSYIEELLRNPDIGLDSMDVLRSTVPFSRYVGIVRMHASFTAPIDVLLDTTSTLRNIVCLGVLPYKVKGNSLGLASSLADSLGCPLLIP